MSKSDYYLDVTINAAIEYVRKKDVIELVGEDTLRYKSIIINDEEFHIFAFFKYGLLIDYDSNTDELQIDELEGVRCGKYTKESSLSLSLVLIDLAVWKSSKKCIKNSNHIMQI
jgi:hypothetical protein